MIRRAFISALPRIDEKHIEPDIQLDEALPMAYGDADRLRQVVNNLLDNAIKFSGGHIALKTAANGGGSLRRWKTMAKASPKPICRTFSALL